MSALVNGHVTSDCYRCGPFIYTTEPAHKVSRVSGDHETKVGRETTAR